jgi:hypothetical protein
MQLHHLAVIAVVFYSPFAWPKCAMWIPCCPDGTPVQGEYCTDAQMGKGPKASKKVEAADNCVRLTRGGAANVWQYKNFCGRTVAAKITRHCRASDASTAGQSRSVTELFGANEVREFNRQNKFGNFCSVLAGNTNEESITAQHYRSP